MLYMITTNRILVLIHFKNQQENKKLLFICLAKAPSRALPTVCRKQDQFTFPCGNPGLAPSVTGLITEPWAFGGQGLLSPAAQTLSHRD